MFTVTFANPKGGTGKTTSCLVLAEQLHLDGIKVGLLDADPNQNLLAWCRNREEDGRTQPFAIAPQPAAEEVFDAIDAMHDRCEFLLVDLEGVADMRFANATMVSDLVVIPLQPSPMENRQAARTTKMLRDTGRRARRDVAHAILLNQLNGFQTNEERILRDELAAHGTEMFAAGLMRREIFKTMFGEGLLLSEMLADLDTVPAGRRRQREKTLMSAIGNARSYYDAFRTIIGAKSHDQAA